MTDLNAVVDPRAGWCGQLISHPNRPVPKDVSVSVSLVGLAGKLTLEYWVRAPKGWLKVPERLAAEDRKVTDGLWKHSCFEAFLGQNTQTGQGSTAYHEINLSPSGNWAAYSFTSYRQGGEDWALFNPGILCEQDQEEFMLRATIPLNPESGPRLGLTAVLESSDGDKSYWALSHASDQPDFHQSSTFLVTLS